MLTPEQIAIARRMRDEGKGWQTIVSATGASLYYLRCEIEPGFRERALANSKRSGERRRKGEQLPRPPAKYKRVRLTDRFRGASLPPLDHAPHGAVGAYSRPSDDLLADRDRRASLEPRSITAALLGDPLPGMSALDRRRR